MKPSARREGWWDRPHPFAWLVLTAFQLPGALTNASGGWLGLPGIPPKVAVAIGVLFTAFNFGRWVERGS